MGSIRRSTAQRYSQKPAESGKFFLSGRLVPLQLVVNDLLDLCIRLISGKHAAIDEQCRRAGNPYTGTRLNVTLDRGHLPSGIQAFVKLGCIQLEIDRALFKIGDAELPLIPKHGIMKFPEVLL